MKTTITCNCCICEIFATTNDNLSAVSPQYSDINIWLLSANFEQSQHKEKLIEGKMKLHNGYQNHTISDKQKVETIKSLIGYAERDEFRDLKKMLNHLLDS